MPLRTAQAVARQLQARQIGMVAMLSGLGPPAGLLRELRRMFLATKIV
jgi:hypothetical protein